MGVFSAVLVVVLAHILSVLAPHIGLLDVPTERKLHASAVPLVGGLAVFIVLALNYFLFTSDPLVAWLVLASTGIVAIGVVDDIAPLGVRIRLLAQLFACIVMISGASLWVKSVGDCSWCAFPDWIAMPITVVFVVGLVNSFNMQDGIDGLAASQTILSLLCLAGTLLAVHRTVEHLAWFGVLIFSLLGFLVINLSLIRLEKVFLGDAGSLLLGFVVSWMLIYFSQKSGNTIHPVAAIWCVALPVFDTVSVMLTRLKARQSLFSADRRHFHHLLVDNGVAPKKALFIIICCSSALSSLGIWVSYKIDPGVSFVFFLFSLIVFVCTLWHPVALKRFLVSASKT